MKAIRKSSNLIIFLLVSQIVFGQAKMSIDEFIRNVKDYHPYIKITQNKLLKAEYKFKVAAGAFDPKLKADWNYKSFGGKTYFDQRSAKVKANTRLGISPILKYQNNSGYYLNSENSNPDLGLIGAGVEVPILNGLIIDESRRNYRIQKINVQKQIFSNDSTENVIIANSLNSYIEWSVSYYKLKALDSLLQIRKLRYDNILNLFRGGILPAMDTLDAFTQLKKTEQELLFNKALYNKSLFKLQNYVWNPEYLDKLDSIVPDESYSLLLALIIDKDVLDVAEHNFIKANRLREQQSKINIRFYAEQFKPKINLELLPLAALSEGVDGFSRNNFMTGVNIELPLYYRKQTNYFKINKLELENIKYQSDLLERKLNTSLNAATLNVGLYKAQYDISIENVANLVVLKNLEEERYLMGESSLIKLNLRENKYISEQLKAFDVLSKYCLELVSLNNLLQVY